MLYKYLPAERVDVLERMLIRFSPLKSLNDPFEYRPIYDASDEFDDATKKALEEFREEVVFDDQGNIVTEEEFVIILGGLRKEKEQEPEVKYLGEKMASNLTDSFGVLSLSRNKSSLLMWSHYASQGEGFVISFKREHAYFHRPDPEGRPSKPMPVIYSTERPIFKNKDSEHTDRIFCHKPQEWAYEEEERVFCMYDSEVPIEGVDKYGQNIRLSAIPRDAINAIYLGYNSSDDLEKRILEAINSNSLNCTLYRGSISDGEYRVKFDEI